MLLPKLTIDRVLVVLDRDHLEGDLRTRSTLASRAISFAKKVGAQVEFFYACHDAALGQKLLLSDVGVLEEREKIADFYATRVSELTLGLPTDGLTISQEVRWDSAGVDAVLRRIAETEPDVVMTRSGDHEYLLGLVSHHDWELIRRSPVPVWFVSDEVAEVDKIVAAIGTLESDEDIISPADYSVARVADALAGAFDAEYFPVHAYQVPQNVAAYAAYGPILGGTSAAPQAVALENQTEACRRVAKEHGERLEAFADYLGIDISRVSIERGNPADVVPRVAEALGADAIVMGARSLSRWQRAVKQVTAEPVLAKANCDVIFAKQSATSDVAVAVGKPIPGEPVMDVEAAITRPDSVFKSPAAVVTAAGLSTELKLHILEAWEQDVRAKLVMQDESGGADLSNPDMLRHIQNAVTKISNEEQRRQEGSIASLASTTAAITH